ncbi:MAG: FMN-binding negative transcriptional regulator [Flavisolibacter sp.]
MKEPVFKEEIFILASSLFLSLMYHLPYYKEKEAAAVMDFIRQHPFAFIMGCLEEKPVATQIPVFIEERGGKLFLSGHMMRNTDHHKAFEKNPNSLCVFTSNHSYVSATWYSDPSQASTWNYMSVHVRGQLRFLDEAALVEVLRKTSLHFENYNNNSSTVYDNLSKEYTGKLLKAIVAFEVEVEEIDHVFKLSQDRDEKSYDQIIDHLQSGDTGSQFIASEMKKRKK